MPEEKEYGYARDLADMDAIEGESVDVPVDATGNAIDAFLFDHFEEVVFGPTGANAIKNHDSVIEYANAVNQVLVKGDLDAFDAEQRETITTASGSKEHQELPGGDPTNFN